MPHEYYLQRGAPLAARKIENRRRRFAQGEFISPEAFTNPLGPPRDGTSRGECNITFESSGHQGRRHHRSLHHGNRALMPHESARSAARLWRVKSEPQARFAQGEFISPRRALNPAGPRGMEHPVGSNITFEKFQIPRKATSSKPSSWRKSSADAARVPRTARRAFWRVKSEPQAKISHGSAQTILNLGPWGSLALIWGLTFVLKGES